MTLAEIAIFTDEVQSTTQFYEQLLGYAPVFHAPSIALFDVKGVKLLIHSRAANMVGGPPNEDHFAFAVKDLDAVCNTFIAQGHSLELAPRDYEWGRSAYLRDPNGRLVELQQEK